MFRNSLGNGADVFGRRSAAAADHIDHAVTGKAFDLGGHRFRRFVILAKLVRQTGIRIGADEGVGNGRQFVEMRTHSVGAERAIEADGKWFGVTQRMPECRWRLAGQGAAGKIGDRAGNHHRQEDALFLEHLFRGEDGSLGVERIEDGFNQDDVGTAVDQPPDLLGIGDAQIVEGNSAVARIIHIRRQGSGAVCRSKSARNETAATVLLLGAQGGATGQTRTVAVQFIDLLFHAIIGLGNCRGRKRIGFENIRARNGVGIMDFLDSLGLRQGQKVVIALKLAVAGAEALAAEMLFMKTKSLNLGSHRAVEDQDALTRCLGESCEHF